MANPVVPASPNCTRVPIRSARSRARRPSWRGLLRVHAGLLLLALPASAAVRHAKPAATGSGTCVDWTNACTLQTALGGAVSGDEVWVRAGVHKPSTTGARDASFNLKNGVGVYGGFVGTETLRTQRNPVVNVSVLSGDLAGDDTTDANGVVLDWSHLVGTDNSRSVVRASSVGATAVLDGVVVTGGYDETPASSIGAGLDSYLSSPTLNQVTFRGNRVTSAGGAIYFWEGSPTLTNCSVIGNAAQAGGGIYLRMNPTVTFSHVLFQDNDTVDAGTAVPHGGALGGSASAVTLTDVQFVGNTAGTGGGVSFSGATAATFTRVLFEGNVSTISSSGGAGLGAESCPVMTDVTFRNNTSAGHGGGMYCQTGSGSQTRVTYTGNTSRLGAGLEVYVATMVVTDALFAGNDASDSGGGLLSWNSTLTLTNAVFRGNRAGSPNGAALAVWGGSATLTGVTISGNQSSTTGGLYSSAAPLTARNTIVWGNGGGEVGIEGGSAAFSYGLVEGGCPASATCTNVLAVDPLFVTPVDPASAPTTAGDVRLLPSSPAIDAGDNDVASPPLPATDLDGNVRRSDSPGVPDTGNGTPPIVDLGAYEFPGPAPDLTATKTNDAGAGAASGTPFAWTVTVANTGSVAAAFGSGAVILRDDLPSTGAAYGSPAVTPTNVTGTVTCAVDASATLLCTASGPVSLGATTGRLVVSLPVTPSAAGTLANPRAAGACSVDPGSVVNESGEANNACSDSVTVHLLVPALATEVHDAAHNVITSAPVGAPIHGWAGVTGAGPVPTGTVTLGLHDDPSCSGTPLATDSQVLLPDGTAESAAFTMVDPGFYYHVAYGGDGAYAPVSGSCTLFLATQPGPLFVVNTLLDDVGDGLCTSSHCTLREAVAAANADPGDNTITFGVSGTVVLGSALPALAANGALAIDGAGQSVAVSGNHAVRVFSVAPAAAVTLNRLTVADGSAPAGSGGGIESAGALAVTESTLSGNQAPRGGGLGVLAGSATLVNVTLSGNGATGVADMGGGGAAVEGGTLSLASCTVAGNSTASASAVHGGGGLATAGGVVSLANTLVAGNASGAGRPDLSGAFVSAGNNVVGNGDGSTGLSSGVQGDLVGTTASPVDARLGALADYGGPAFTIALLPGSPALDAVVFDAPNGCPASDQRGIARPQGAACDAGAFESRGFAATASGGTPQSTVLLTPFPLPLTVTVASAFSEPVAGGLVTFAAPGAGASATLTGGGPTATLVLDGSGQASAAATANGTPGSYLVGATAPGVAPTASFALTNLTVPTTLVLGSEPNPSTWGETVTLTAILAPPVAGATIAFLDGAASLGSATADAAGVASLSTSSLASGAHTLSATFAGDASHSGGTAAPVTHVVLPRPVTVTADAQAKVYGAPDPSLTWQVTSGSLVPGDAFSGALSRTPGEDVGAYPILQGTLALSGNYALSWVGASLTISSASTTTTLAGSPSPATVGANVHLVATVAAVPPSAGTPAGNVTFLEGAVVLCAATPLDPTGRATCDLAAPMPLGLHTLTATFDGSASWLPGSGAFGLEVSGTAPVITSPAIATFAVGYYGSFLVEATGLPAPALSIVGGTLPAGLVLHDDGDGTATISGRAEAAGAGTHTLTISARNDVGEATQVLTLVVDSFAVVPALGGKGLVVLTLLLALAGAFVLRRSGAL